MPALLVLPGFPATNAPGTEGLGVGVDTTTGFEVTPNGMVGTPAQIQALITAALASGASTLYIAQLWRQMQPF